MDLKLENGNIALGPGGLPQMVGGLEELLQNAWLRLSIRRGSLPYCRELGSGLWQWDPQEDHALDRAVALANEALLDLPGVRAKRAEATEDGVRFLMETPLGEGEIIIGDIPRDT